MNEQKDAKLAEFTKPTAWPEAREANDVKDAGGLGHFQCERA
jgi:hypothetical protein